MTSGSVTKPGATIYDYSYSKVWNGANGKYEPITNREKWNNYTSTFTSQSDQLGQTSVVARVNAVADFTQWTAADEVRLQSQLVERIKGHKFNLAVDLAQANQLVTMLTRTIQQMGRTLLYLKRGNVSAAFRELGLNGRDKKLKSKDVSGRWLEMQYGWGPFLGSCYESAKAFEAISQGRSSRIVAKLGRKIPGEASASPTNYSAPAVIYCRKRIICELNEELSFARTLGLLDPLSVAWEILPFSFVFDWFLPVGTYLENLAVIPNLNGRFCSTLTQGYDSTFGVAKNPAYSGTRRIGKVIRTERVVSTNLNVQRPTFVNPITAATWKRIPNAVALAHQLLGS